MQVSVARCWGCGGDELELKLLSARTSARLRSCYPPMAAATAAARRRQLWRRALPLALPAMLLVARPAAASRAALMTEAPAGAPGPEEAAAELSGGSSGAPAPAPAEAELIVDTGSAAWHLKPPYVSLRAQHACMAVVGHAMQLQGAAGQLVRAALPGPRAVWSFTGSFERACGRTRSTVGRTLTTALQKTPPCRSCAPRVTITSTALERSCWVTSADGRSARGPLCARSSASEAARGSGTAPCMQSSTPPSV